MSTMAIPMANALAINGSDLHQVQPYTAFGKIYMELLMVLDGCDECRDGDRSCIPYILCNCLDKRGSQSLASCTVKASLDIHSLIAHDTSQFQPKPNYSPTLYHSIPFDSIYHSQHHGTRVYYKLSHPTKSI